MLYCRACIKNRLILCVKLVVPQICGHMWPIFFWNSRFARLRKDSKTTESNFESKNFFFWNSSIVPPPITVDIESIIRGHDYEKKLTNTQGSGKHLSELSKTSRDYSQVSLNDSVQSTMLISKKTNLISFCSGVGRTEWLRWRSVWAPYRPAWM